MYNSSLVKYISYVILVFVGMSVMFSFGEVNEFGVFVK